MMPTGLAITINAAAIAFCLTAIGVDIFAATYGWERVVAFLDMLEKRPGLLSMIGATIATFAAAGGAILGGVVAANRQAHHANEAERLRIIRKTKSLSKAFEAELRSIARILDSELYITKEGQHNASLRGHISGQALESLTVVYQRNASDIALLESKASSPLVRAYTEIAVFSRSKLDNTGSTTQPNNMVLVLWRILCALEALQESSCVDSVSKIRKIIQHEPAFTIPKRDEINNWLNEQP